MNIRNLPLFEGLFHTAPPYHTGSVVQNRLGWQVVRVLARLTAFKFRSVPKVNSDNQYVSEIKEQGIVCIPDFLEKAKWHEVRAEYDNAVKNGMIQFQAYKPGENYSMRVA